MRRAIVLAHFDPHGQIDDYVVTSLREYRKVADQLVLVSASARNAQGEVRHVVDRFIARDNVGYDFCSWREGIASIDSLGAIDELICVNDSVYGPARPLAPILADARVSEADAWGMCMSVQGTESRDHRPAPHLQSWFVAFRQPVLQSTAFRQFWASVLPLHRKADVIDRYEIGLSERLFDAGFRLAAIHDARLAPRPDWGDLRPMLSLHSPLRSIRMARRCRRHICRQNPAEARPVRLLRDGVPYLKSSVLRVNHYRLDLDFVRGEFERLTGYDLDMVRQHQCRVQGRRQHAH